MTLPEPGPSDHAGSVTLGRATRVWARIGLNSFGGPAGQIAVMHREVVDELAWVDEGRFLHALNYCMILPGPEAQQLATYLGWLMNGVRGGIVAGTLFVLPGFVAMLALSVAYAELGHLTVVSGMLAGIQAAVVAVVAQAVVRIGRRTLRTPVLRVVAATSFLAIFAFAVPFPYIVVVAGSVGWWLGRRRPDWVPATGSAGPADETPPHRAQRRALFAAAGCALLWLTPVVGLLVLRGGSIYAQQGVLFSKSALVTFGGAYAVLGYIAQQAVTTYGWIRPQDMVVGLGLAETTPGPLILVVEFVGFLAAYRQPGPLPPLLAGLLGALVTVWVTFLPCFLFIFLGAPYVERLRGNAGLSRALTTIGAAVAGVVLNLAVWFAVHTAFATVTDQVLGPVRLPVPTWSSVRVASVAVSAVALLLVFRFGVGTMRLVLLAAAAGAVLAGAHLL